MLLNRSDVKYIFDADILDLFVRPQFYLFGDSQNINEKRAFSIDWGISLNKDNADEVKDSRVQHALIMSEYLMSGNLPGFDGFFYFTPWHSRELSQGFHVINAHLSAAKSSLRASLFGLVEKYVETINADYADTGTVELGIDIMSEVTKLLGEDQTIEPIEQMGRMLKIFNSKSRVITEHIELPNKVAEEIREDAQSWADRLSSIGRDGDSLRDDAFSLAYIRTICRLNKDAAVIFVTGDNELFNLYRDWYYKNAIQEPFFLRRFAQYNPILNTKSASSDIRTKSGTSNLFESIDNLASAVVIRYALITSPNHFDRILESINSNKNRFQWLAWHYSHLGQETHSEPATLIKKQLKDINRLKKELAWIQEKASGIFSQVSSRRLPSDFKKKIENAANKDNFFESVRAFINDRLGDIDSLAITFFDRAERSKISFMYGLRSGPHRTPDTILYKIGNHTLAEIIKSLDEEKDPIPLSFSSFVDLRAYAAAVALSTRCWSEAEQYARTARALGKSSAASYELDFLHCVASRYSTANKIFKIDSSNTENLISAWTEFEKPIKILKSISGKIGLRYDSELAAIRVFKAEAMVVHDAFSEASLELNLAINALSFCIDEIIRGSDHHDAVIDQVMHNYASSMILATVIRCNLPDIFLNSFLKKRISAVRDHFSFNEKENISRFLEMERTLFEFLTGDSLETTGKLKDLLSFSTREPSSLQMDSKLCDLLLLQFEKNGSHAIKKISMSLQFS